MCYRIYSKLKKTFLLVGVFRQQSFALLIIFAIIDQLTYTVGLFLPVRAV